MVNTGWSIFGNNPNNNSKETTKEKLTEQKIKELLKGDGLYFEIINYEELKNIINNINNNIISMLSLFGNTGMHSLSKDTYKLGFKIRNQNNSNEIIKNTFEIKNINDINILIAQYINIIL